MSDNSSQDPSRPDLASTATAAGRTVDTGERTPAVRRHGVRYETGMRLDAFVIEGFIAEGGFGSVYRARHDRIGPVALKVSHLAADELSTECLALQQNEIEALLQLRHPSLVRVLDHGTLSDRRHYLALELVEGESLHHYMEHRGRVDVLEAISLVRRLADALAHCHHYEILHLDLTPRNVIVVDAHAPELKIVDFGVAAFAENWLDTLRRPTAGTPRYMAPEMIAEPPQVGPHCDVYALGLIFYELITGQFAFDADNTWDLFQKKRRGEMLPVTAHVPEIPEAIATTVHALLHPRPARRDFSAASLSQHLKALYFDILRRSEGGGRTGRPTGEVYAHAAPLVGRDNELTELLARGRAALGGNAGAGEPRGPGWASVLIGDPGIGKTRLLAELTQRLDLARHATGYGRCREHGNLVSYASWRECLGQLERVVTRTSLPGGDAARAEVRALLADPAGADLCALIPALEPVRSQAGAAAPRTASAETGSSRIGQAVRRLVTAISAHLPTALVLEDLHWADQGTLDVLGELVSAPLPPGLLLLCTARPEPALPPPSAWPALDRLRLAPLDEPRSAELLRALAGDMAPGVIAELTAAIPLLRLGNPLVDTQVILHLKREGLLGMNSEGRVVLGERFDRGYEPPTSISAVLERRIRHVPERARQALAIASLIGRQFRISDLAGIAAPEVAAPEVEVEVEAEVEAAVREAVELALCRAHGDDCWFVHDVIRDHFVATVPAERAPELHARIARLLGDRDTPAATLAHHLDRAGDRAAAAVKYVEGGIEADRVHDLVGSSGNLRRALALYLELAPSPERDRALARTTYELARITCLLGNTAEPLEQLDRSRRAMIAPPADAAAMLDSAYARVHYAGGDFARAMDHSERCLAVTGPALGPYQCVPANMLGRALCASGHFGPSVEVLERGCRLLRDAGDLVELAHSEGLLGTSLAFTGALDASWRHIDESRRIAELLDNPTRRMGVCLYETLHHEAAFRWDDGIRASAQLLAHAEEHSLGGLYLYLGTIMAGRHHFHIGELERARHLLGNAINLSTIFGIRTMRSWAQAYLGDVHFISGQIDEAMRWYTTAHELASAGRGDGFGIPLARIGMAHASARQGADTARVVELAEAALAAFEAASNVAGLATALVRYLEALAACGDDGERAAPVRARLGRLLARLGAPRCEFWPERPATATDADRALALSDYWHQRAVTGIVAAAAPTPADRRGGDLLINLSTVDGFVPAFAARPPR